MFKKLQKLLDKSYSPYSNIKVSSIIVTTDGKEFKGVNIENSVYSPTMCAERSALCSLITEGYGIGDVEEVHVLSSVIKPLYPCGVCLQSISEFMNFEKNIFIYKNDGTVLKHKFKELLPYAVVKESFE